MTRDDIIRMAQKVGIVSPEETGEVWCAGEWQLLEFAKLVAAAEREACAKVCEGINSAEDYYGERVELICVEAIRARGAP
jgi:hypothetical protein